MGPGATAARRLVRPRKVSPRGANVRPPRRVPDAPNSPADFPARSVELAQAPQARLGLELLPGPQQVGGPSRPLRAAVGVEFVVREERPAGGGDPAERGGTLERDGEIARERAGE